MANTLQYAKIFTENMDKLLTQTTTTAWMDANANEVRYNGGDTVNIPNLSMSGYGDYDRTNGQFPKGSASLTWESRKISNDRAKSFYIDRFDDDETNFVASAGNIIAEFLRTRAVPEIDAYRYAALAKNARTTNTYTPSVGDIFSTLKADIAGVADAIGDAENLIITMSIPCTALLDTAGQLNHQIQMTDFQRGEINTKVRSIDGIPIIPVQSARLWSEIDLLNTDDGGFAPSDGASAINWIICHRTAPIAFVKGNCTKIFDPDANQDGDGWKIQTRRYHDLWVADNKKKSVLVSVKGAED